MASHVSVSAAEFVRNFGLWQERALRQPIAITHHGRERLVLAAADFFLGDQTSSGDGAAETAAGARARLSCVLNNMTEGFVALSPELAFLEINRVTEIYFGLAAEEVEGRLLSAVFPSLRGSVVLDRIRRVLRTRESLALETDHFVFDGRQIALQIFPLGEGVGILFSNLTEQADLEDAIARKEALETAVLRHPRVSCVHCDAAGRFTSVDETFSTWVRFDRDALIDVRLSDLAHPTEKRAVAGLFEEVLASRAPASARVRLLAKDLEERTLDLSLCPHPPNARRLGVCVVAAMADD